MRIWSLLLYAWLGHPILASTTNEPSLTIPSVLGSAPPIVPPSTASNVLYYTSSSINTDTDLPTILNIDILDCPTKEMLDINAQISSLISNTFYRYNKQLRLNINFPQNCSNQLNTFTTCESHSGCSCNATSNYFFLQSKTIISSSTSVVICISPNSCQTIADYTTKKELTNVYIFNINNVILPTPPKTMLPIGIPKLGQQILCPKQKELVPLPFYTNQKLQCGCFCPVGYTMVKGHCHKDIDTPDPNDILRHHCRWIKKQFSYLHSDYCEANKCTVTDLFKKIGFTTLPFPDETYLNFADNPYDKAKPIQGPRIVLNITKYTGPNQTVPKWFDPQTFSWKDFQLNREKIMSQYVRLDTTGKYVITLLAYGYSPKPAKCTTIISAKDNFPPQVICKDANCPVIKSSTAPMNYSNFNNAKKALTDFNTWVSKIVNDGFGSKKRCDNVQYSVRLIGDSNLKPVTSSINAMDLQQSEIQNLKQYTSSLIMTKESVTAIANYCTKCYSLSYAAKEAITYYNFPLVNQKKGTWTIDSCVGTAKCSIEQCLTQSPSEWFNTSIQISSNYATSSKSIIATKFPQISYNPSTEIHLIPTCGDLNDPKCQFTAPVRDFFTISSSFQANWKAIFQPFISDPSALLRYRYNVNGGEWKDLVDYSKITLQSLINSISIEVYTACGKLGATHKFYIYVHPIDPKKPLNICYNMEQLGWYQSTTGEVINGDKRLCNFPETDFGEFSFSYDGIEESKNLLTLNKYPANYLTFMGITCTIQYKINNQLTKPVTIIPLTNKKLLNRYAVNLIRTPTTMEMTTVLMSCNSTFLTADKAVVTDNCKKELVFHDCNDPGWNCPYGDCLLQCPADKPHPSQICQGNVISYTNGQTAFKNLAQPADCCTKCGPASCQSLSTSTPLGLKYCVVNSSPSNTPITLSTGASASTPPAAHAVLLEQNTPSLWAILGFSTVGIVLIIEFQRRRHFQVRPNDIDNNYRALLADE